MTDEQRDGSMRYRLLETVRQYALELLSAAGETRHFRGRHLEAFLEFAEEAATMLYGREQVVGLERLDSEIDNLRAALQWSRSAEGGTERGARLVFALRVFFDVRCHRREALEYLHDLIPTSHRWPPRLCAGMLRQTALYVGLQGDHATARALREQSLEIYRALTDREGIAIGLNELGYSMRNLGHLEAAQALWEESLCRFAELGDEHLSPEGASFRAWAVRGIGYAAWRKGDRTTGESRTQESLRLFRELGAPFGIAFALTLQAKDGMLEALEYLAFVASAHGSIDRAVQLWGAASNIREAVGLPSRTARIGGEDTVRAALGDAAFAAAWAEGRALTMEASIALALGDAGDGVP